MLKAQGLGRYLETCRVVFLRAAIMPNKVNLGHEGAPEYCAGNFSKLFNYPRLECATPHNVSSQCVSDDLFCLVWQ